MNQHLRRLARRRQDERKPAAAKRGAESFFADPDPDWTGIRHCTGTSCQLNAAKPGSPQPRSKGVYCLGFCDRSPARIDAAGVLIDEHGRVRPRDPEVYAMPQDPVVSQYLNIGPDLQAATGLGVYDALISAVTCPPNSIIEEVLASQLCGRGGAAFSTGEKWRLASRGTDPQKVVVANGDEGDPGSFVDRVLMEQAPHSLIEAMALCGRAIGANKGFVYVRAEYPVAARALTQAIIQARHAGYLGNSILDSDFSFDIQIARGRGSYVCGEETAMLNAMEDLRGEIRLRPPFPTEDGWQGRPTVVDNVETLINVPWILTRGAAAYRAMGTAASCGTKALSLNAGFDRPGLYEVEFGTSLGEVLEAAGLRHSNPQGVLLGGPMGSLVMASQWDVPICYQAMRQRGIRLGHGGVVAVPADVDWSALLRHLLQFFADESCGRCVPCSEGSAQTRDLAAEVELHADQIGAQLDSIEATSLCAFGHLMPGPLRQILDQARESS